MQWPVLTLLYTRLVRNVIDSSLPPDSHRGSISQTHRHLENSSAPYGK